MAELARRCQGFEGGRAARGRRREGKKITDTTHPPPAAVRTDWRGLLVVFIAGVAAAMHIFKLAPALPTMREELGMGLALGGFLFATVNIVGMLGGVALGRACDRAGHVRALASALALTAGASFIGSLVYSPVMLAAMRVVEGIGYVAVSVTAPAVMAELAAPRDRGLALGLWSCFIPAGSALATWLFPELLENGGWRSVWRATAVLSLLLGAACLLLARDVAPRPAREAAADRGIYREPLAWALLALFAIFAFVNIGLYAWSPSYLVEVEGLGLDRAGRLAAFAMACTIIGNLGGGWLLRHGMLPGALLTLSGLTMGAALLAALVPLAPPPVRFAALVIALSVGGAWPTALYHTAAVRVPLARRAAMNGMLIHGSNGGMFFGPLAVGVLVSATGSWVSLAWVLPPLIVAASLAALRLQA